ncbi:MAG: CvpA family protein [Pseudomonadota bacterium]
MADITWIDIIIIAIFLLSTVIAFLRGFVREIISLATWIAAIVLALTQADQVALMLPESMDSGSFPFRGKDYGSDVRVGVAFILIFVAVLILGGIINFLFGQIMKAQNLKKMDRFLGTLFGLVRASVIIVIMIMMAVAFTTLQESYAWQNSYLISPFESAAKWAVSKLPEEYAYNFIFLEPAMEMDEDLQL